MKPEDQTPKHGFEPARNEIQWGHRYRRSGSWHFFPAERGQEQAEQHVQTILSSPGGQDAGAYVVFREVQYGDWTKLPEPTPEKVAQDRLQAHVLDLFRNTGRGHIYQCPTTLLETFYVDEKDFSPGSQLLSEPWLDIGAIVVCEHDRRQVWSTDEPGSLDELHAILAQYGS